MTLDLPTLMVMQSFAMACAGAVLLFAWTQNRAVSALAVWGIADFSAAGGILLLMFSVQLEQPALSAFGGALLCTQSGLIWKAARNIDGKPAPLVLALLGGAVIIIGGAVPLVREYEGSIGLAGGAAYTALTAISLWRGRGDGLIARWALCSFAIMHALALSIGTLSTFIGTTGQDSVPRLASLFGFIYFESVVFALGTAVFALALIKERNEAASLFAASIDALTGVANRAALLGSAERAMQRCRRVGAPIAVVMFDLDRFKRINDLICTATLSATRCCRDFAILRPRRCDRRTCSGASAVRNSQRSCRDVALRQRARAPSVFVRPLSRPASSSAVVRSERASAAGCRQARQPTKCSMFFSNKPTPRSMPPKRTGETASSVPRTPSRPKRSRIFSAWLEHNRATVNGAHFAR
jgi:hypothetical protein